MHISTEQLFILERNHIFVWSGAEEDFCPVLFSCGTRVCCYIHLKRSSLYCVDIAPILVLDISLLKTGNPKRVLLQTVNTKIKYHRTLLSSGCSLFVKTKLTIRERNATFIFLGNNNLLIPLSIYNGPS